MLKSLFKKSKNINHDDVFAWCEHGPDGTPTPAERVRRMKRILEAGFDASEHDSYETPCVDLLADLMHLIHIENLDIDAITESALNHFMSETQ